MCVAFEWHSSQAQISFLHVNLISVAKGLSFIYALGPGSVQNAEKVGTESAGNGSKQTYAVRGSGSSQDAHRTDDGRRGNAAKDVGQHLQAEGDV